MCAVGISEIPTSGGSTVRICDSDLTTIADQFLPTITFAVPYQDVDGAGVAVADDLLVALLDQQRLRTIGVDGMVIVLSFALESEA